MAKKEENITNKKEGTFLSDEIISICMKNKIHYYYDMNISNTPSRLVYTDFMNCLGGVYVCSGSDYLNEAMIFKHLTGEKEDYTDFNYTEMISKSIDDKYSLYPLFSKTQYEKVVILPGSNILSTIVDDKKLIRAVAEGAYVKPHPFTTPADLRYLKQLFGRKCLHHMIGGAQLIKNAKHIYVTGSSELFLYSIALGKIVHDISIDGCPAKGGYQALFKVITSFKHYERPIVLNKILSYKHGGIFFPFDVEQKNLEDFILNNIEEE